MGSSCTGRLMVIPSAPSLPCRTIRMTVRWKRGSGILGEAISSWPASEGGLRPGIVLRQCRMQQGRRHEQRNQTDDQTC